jgi:hypothetical protein
MASFDQLLEECLEDLARSGDVEASLERYPELADQLRPLLQTAEATQRSYALVPDAPGGLADGRERFLAAAAQQRERGIPAPSGTMMETPARRRWSPAALAWRLAALTMLLVFGMAALGGGLVWAADDSLPGDALYPVKLAVEDARLALASGSDDQVDLALALMEERVGEMQALLRAGRPIPEKAVVRMERHVARALTRASEADDEQKDDLLAQIAGRAQLQEQRLAEAQASVPQQGNVSLRNAVLILQQGAEEAEAGLSDPNTYQRRYRNIEGEPEPKTEPEQRQERHQRDNSETEELAEPTPYEAPKATRTRRQASATPRPALQGIKETETPQPSQEIAEPTATPFRPGATATPKNTPQGPPPTEAPQATSQPSEATAAPQPTEAPQPTPGGQQATPTDPPAPRDPPETPGGPHQTPGPKPPGGGNGGGGH